MLDVDVIEIERVARLGGSLGIEPREPVARATRVVLGDQLHIAVLEAPVFSLVLDAKVWQFQVSVDHL